MACYIHKILDEYLLKICFFLPSFIHLIFLSLPVWRACNFFPFISGIWTAISSQANTALLVRQPTVGFLLKDRALSLLPYSLDIHVLSSVRYSYGDEVNCLLLQIYKYTDTSLGNEKNQVQTMQGLFKEGAR